ncbi:enamine/imine deaminase [Natrialba magadii ATCC 43099]|uniref:Enamine/imine deaminase n=1 Tax=Natrialba magadii (strain ATCC 43099 / DSM 3394 / CCM 3739 / CIP 104546 / IAM 13178 / JCM 8861 / NBRC 102185 / NCIMB 2190 / MS3) TaxID=547559 RepID=D3SVM8_NATMM|nr:Rid family hydrolase [Natrialba magadii]ADD05636.1 enamine/imine deaminase [Natrialba magadii ATCC 43099]ELY29951.1 endoribonuclease L-PSP [Natrialba magadii ATCC 43099]
MEPVTTDDAPSFTDLYSLPIGQGMIHGETLHAVQLAGDPETGEIVGDTMSEQTEQTLDNIEATLEAGGSSFDDVIKVTVYVTDLDSFDAFNDVYEQYVSEPYPVRCVVEVSNLAATAMVEVAVEAAV